MDGGAGGRGGMGGIVFQMEGTSFLSGRGAPLGGIGFDGGGGSKKIVGWGGRRPPMLLQLWETVGGYMLQKNRMGRKIVFFFSNFLTLFFSVVYKEHMKH